MNKILIYTARTSNRLVYTLDLLIGDLLGLDYTLTHNEQEFNASALPKFAYSSKQLKDEIFFESAGLLFETTIQNQPIAFAEHEDVVGLYVADSSSAVSFDIFSTAFFMASRYEEYLPGKLDKYDRYRASYSLNYKLGILEKPMVNFYALAIKKILLARYANLKFKDWYFNYTVSVDIDMAYSYLHKGLKRNLGGALRSFIFSDFAGIKERLMVLSERQRDPFDTYDYIFEVCRQHNIPTNFFFLLGQQNRFDKNISPDDPAFRNLITDIAGKTETGIHLSFRSNKASSIMKKEIDILEEITGNTVAKNRFHYLRFQLPGSYNRIAKLGITDDYSMGYAAHIGFRAGLCNPFMFFDLKANQVTGLKVHPFAFMDTTLVHYNQHGPEHSLEKIQAVMRHVKKAGGQFTGLWHNSSLTETREWKGWRNIFETVAREAAAIAGPGEVIST